MRKVDAEDVVSILGYFKDLEGYGPCVAEIYAAFRRVTRDMWTRAWMVLALRSVSVRA